MWLCLLLLFDLGLILVLVLLTVYFGFQVFCVFPGVF